METNLCFYCRDSHIRRGFVDDREVDDTKLKRLFRVLNNTSCLEEQKIQINKIISNYNYSKKAQKLVVYRYGRSKARITESKFDEEKQQYLRGKYQGVLNF